MKAVIWYDRNDLRIEDIPEPTPDQGQVKLKVKACGICSSEVHEYQAGPFLVPMRPHPLTGKCGGPLVIGHEFGAEVAEVGQGVTGFQPGERVTVNTLLYCGQCHYCKKGQYNMCVVLGATGGAADGGMADYVIVNESQLVRIPDSITDDMATFTEPLAVAVRAVKKSRLMLGHTAAIVGAGPLGLLIMQVCKSAGASQVYVVEPMAARREMALKLGATAVFDPVEGDAGKAVAALTDNLRCDVSFDCAGNQAGFDTAVKTTGRRGVICVAGLHLIPAQVPFLKLWMHEKELVFVTGYEDEFPAAVALLADGRINVNELITDRIKLDDAVEKGFKPLVEEPEKHVKVLVYPE